MSKSNSSVTLFSNPQIRAYLLAREVKPTKNDKVKAKTTTSSTASTSVLVASPAYKK